MTASAGQAASKPYILVVDDSPANIDVLKTALRQDYTIRVATNGELALRIVASDHKPDLLLLDVMLPGISGYEVLAALRADPSTRHIPVIFATGLAEAGDEVKGLELGAADYITKPFNVAVVRARVCTQLALRKANAALEAQNVVFRQERGLIEEIITRMREAREFDGRHLRHLMTSVDKTNGDVLFSGFTPGGSQWVLVGDVAGHGPAAAIAIPLLSSVFYRCVARETSIEALLAEINAVMCDKLPAGIFMPYCLVRVAISRDQVQIWNGGLPGCALIEVDGRVTEFEAQTFPVGVEPDLMMEPGAGRPEPFPAGSRLCLFTDGAAEMFVGGGGRLGSDGVLALLAKSTAPLEASGFRLELEGLHQNADFADDITIVEIHPFLV
jgi:CheY-like chemotaxis protein